MVPNSPLQSCFTALDRCILELKVQLDALIERREYTSVEKVAGVIASVGQCRDQLGQSAGDAGGKSAGSVNDVGRSLSAKLSNSHEQVPLGPRVIAKSTKAIFMCSDHELLKQGSTKDDGTYTHRVAWPYVLKALDAMLDKRSEWRVTDLCKFANDPARSKSENDRSTGLLKETHVYLVLAFLAAYNGGSAVRGGSKRGVYQVCDKGLIRNLGTLFTGATSSGEIEDWLIGGEDPQACVASV